jgi:glucose-6-phosphate isomerase
MPCPTSLPSWARLQAFSTQQPSLKDISPFRLQAEDISADLSLQPIRSDVRGLLAHLIDEAHVPARVDAMVRGEAINVTEQRPVLHMALRASGTDPAPWGADIAQAIATQRERFLHFADAVRDGRILTSNGLPFSHIVNIGIGGSDLGPRMVCAALGSQAQNSLPVFFISNPDPWCIQELTQQIDPLRTLFIVQSKSFTTQETLAVFATLKGWLLSQGIEPSKVMQQFVAVTARPDLAHTYQFEKEKTFIFWDWVGGRTSVWSAIGLPIALHCGSEAFEQLLAGANAMDMHFQQAAVHENLPYWLALIGIWNRNFLNRTSHAIVCYDWRLRHLPAFLQQLEMESNGKSIQVDGQPSKVKTAPVLWGGLGLDGQHAYFQMLHQGTDIVPVDFLSTSGDEPSSNDAKTNKRIVDLNLKAQRQALAQGRSVKETIERMRDEKISEDRIHQLAVHRSYAGNRPSNHLVLKNGLTAFSLGQLLALYEHKVFTQAVIWNIPAFDQWGVELGKTMAKRLEETGP